MYMMPSFLWSTVTTHSCTRSSHVPWISPGGVRSTALPMGRVESAITKKLLSCRGPVSGLLQAFEVRDDLVDLGTAQLHGGHETSRLYIIGILDPKLQVGSSIVSCTRGERIATREVSQIRSEFSVGGGTANH